MEFRDMFIDEFLETHFIKEIGEINEKYPFISFLLIANGIELLGKCKNKIDIWDNKQRYGSEDDFNLAIKTFTSFIGYRGYLAGKYKLYDTLRCGFSHRFTPKNGLILDIVKIEGVDKLNLKCEQLYSDFKEACEEVISEYNNNKLMPTNDKIYKPIMRVRKEDNM